MAYSEATIIRDASNATITIGQQLASASLPVVLPATQITALTPIAGNLEVTQLLVKAKTDNLDVALSTLLKPADTLTALGNITGTISLPTGAATSALQTTGNTALGTIDTSVNTLLKPASTLAGITTVSTVTAVTAITNALPAGTNTIGNVNQTLATNGFTRITDGTNTMPTMDVLTRAGFQKITDGTNNATIKASTTAPVLADTAIVTTLSPNVSTVATAIAKAEDAVHTTGDVGVMSLGVRNETLTTLTSAVGDYSPIATDADGSVFIKSIASTVGGMSSSHLVVAATINATVVKASAGILYGMSLSNLAGIKYVKFYDKATAPAPATDAALLKYVVNIQANTSRDILFGDIGIQFTSGISFVTVTGIANTDATAVAASTLIVDTTFK